MMHAPVRSSTEDQSQGEHDDDEEKKDLDERSDVFEPGKNGIRQQEDDETGEHED